MQQTVRERSEKKCESNSPTDTEVGEGGGGGGAPCTGGSVFLQPMEDNAAADIHAAELGRPHAGAGGDVLKEAAAHGEPTLEQVLLRGTVACGEDPMQEQVYSEGPMLDEGRNVRRKNHQRGSVIG